MLSSSEHEIHPLDDDAIPASTHSLPFYTQVSSFSHAPMAPVQQPFPPQPRITTRLVTNDLTTRPLTNPTAPLAKTPTIIPATEKRYQSSLLAPLPRRHRPFVLLSVLVSSMLMLVLVSLLVAPVDNGQHQQDIIQTLHDAISRGSFNSFNPLQQITQATPVTQLLINKGSCGGTDIWGACVLAGTDNGTMGTGQMQSPLSGAVITQGFAHPEYQQWCGCWRPHTGIDLAAPYGTPITTVDSGQVIWTGWDWSGLGWAVKISHGGNIATIYGHLARFIVSVGQNVTKGQVIGDEGSTGASTGPHLHFMVLVNNMWVDPTLYISLP